MGLIFSVFACVCVYVHAYTCLSVFKYSDGYRTSQLNNVDNFCVIQLYGMSGFLNCICTFTFVVCVSGCVFIFVDSNIEK